MPDLTPEQAARCDALARRIAERDPNWPKPGMACADGHHGWRRIDGNLWYGQGAGLRTIDDAASGPVAESCRRAIANGPDWRDDATLGCLLLSMPWHELLFDGESWQCLDAMLPPSAQPQLAGVGRAGAILSAKLAQLGGAK